MGQGNGVLVDLTKCIGCGSCTVACKLWNKLEFDKKKPTTGNDVKLVDKNWTVVTKNEVQDKIENFGNNKKIYTYDSCANFSYISQNQEEKYGKLF
mgnify:CR=1 FL=1